MLYQEILLLLYFIYVHRSNCQRRIVNGKDVSSDKRYMIYLLQAPESYNQANYWLCGGAIVHPWYILTASCLSEGDRVFVIAGLNYLVNVTDVHSGKNECAYNTKRRIVKLCFPDNTRNQTLGQLDIVLGKVDKPYSRHEGEFKKFKCAYVPRKIGVNYYSEFHTQFRDVMALGWGSSSKITLENDGTNINERFLKYTVGYLMDNAKCSRLIPKYFLKTNSICFNDRGSLDDRGKFLDFIEDYNLRKFEKDFNGYGYDLRRFAGLSPDQCRRLGGLCQNDHGGPLVGWIGGKETIMGVASFFMVAKNMSCIGPSVFTTTACVNKFLYCKLEQDGARRSTWCKHAKNFTEVTDIPWTKPLNSTSSIADI